MGISTHLKKFFTKEHLIKLIIDPKHVSFICFILLFLELALNIIIVQWVPYTEIDWVAYMQEVEGFLNGTLDYKLLKGDTGPLVYPAGFVYIYTVLYYITNHGSNVRLAQYIFVALYMGQLYLTFRIYRKTAKVPPYAIIISTLTSYRVHSIYVLRLFNDPFAVMLFYLALNLYIEDKWLIGNIFYSLAVSVKMNVLLYAPCLFLVLLLRLGLIKTLQNIVVCGTVQVLLGLPFLYVNFWSYIKGSFDLGRVFQHQWTVNYRFLDTNLFSSPYFHLALLLLHVLLLVIFYKPVKCYLAGFVRLNQICIEIISKQKISKKSNRMSKQQQQFLTAFENQLKKQNKQTGKNDEGMEEVFERKSQLIVLPFFVTNFIGILCARSLHYQFYTWYFHSLLYLAYCTRFRKPFMFLILALIEYCWNVYPSTNISSLLLHTCHLLLIYGIYMYMKQSYEFVSNKSVNKAQ